MKISLVPLSVSNALNYDTTATSVCNLVNQIQNQFPFRTLGVEYSQVITMNCLE